jgi:hypothetical protein
VTTIAINLLKLELTVMPKMLSVMMWISLLSLIPLTLLGIVLWCKNARDRLLERNGVETIATVTELQRCPLPAAYRRFFNQLMVNRRADANGADALRHGPFDVFKFVLKFPTSDGMTVSVPGKTLLPVGLETLPQPLTALVKYDVNNPTHVYLEDVG